MEEEVEEEELEVEVTGFHVTCTPSHTALFECRILQMSQTERKLNAPTLPTLLIHFFSR